MNTDRQKYCIPYNSLFIFKYIRASKVQIIAIASQKGGSGKSTIAIHLAALAVARGRKTLLADMDRHSQTSTEWGKQRKISKPLVAPVPLNKLSAMLSQAEEKSFDTVVLDLPPYVDDVVQLVTEKADITLVPCRPSFADLRTLPRVLKQIHKPYFVVLNACPPGYSGQEGSKTSEARRVLVKNNILVCPISVTQRVAFTDALNGGEAVNEFDPSSKASFEIEKLLNWVDTETQKQ